MHLSKEVEELLEELKEVRRDLHEIPELGFEEHKTATYIISYLEGLGIEIQTSIVGTGIIAYFRGKSPKRTYCFRADMDALGVVEENDVAFKSKHPSKMHACGHDGHMAILLGFAKFLAKNSHKIKDNIVLLFQPAEEGPGGALPIMKSGILKKYAVEEIYGLHLFPDIEEGRIGVKAGAMMSQNGEFDIVIKGKSGHGAMPHTAIDSVVIASEMVLGLQSIVSRDMNPIDPAVLTIGRIEGGEKRNVIAREVVLEGTVRTFSQESYDLIKQRVMEHKQGIELKYKCCIDVVFRDMYPAVYNDASLTEAFIEAQEKEIIDRIDPIMLAEDFSHYQQEIAGVFFFLGSKNKQKGYIYSLHNGKFNFDERVLAYGLQSFLNILKHKDAMEI